MHDWRNFLSKVSTNWLTLPLPFPYSFLHFSEPLAGMLASLFTTKNLLISLSLLVSDMKALNKWVHFWLNMGTMWNSTACLLFQFYQKTYKRKREKQNKPTYQQISWKLVVLSTSVQISTCSPLAFLLKTRTKFSSFLNIIKQWFQWKLEYKFPFSSSSCGILL